MKKKSKKTENVKELIKFLDIEIQLLESEILNYDISSSVGRDLFDELQNKILQRNKLNEKSNSVR
jgi:exopolysaccharide biosynthesis protein